MEQTITYNKATDTFEVHMSIPKTMRGTHTYDDTMEWKQDAVSVFIDKNLQQFMLCHTQYLDYKDSLQSTQPILYFDTEEEALKFANTHKLMIEWAQDLNNSRLFAPSINN